MTTTTTTRPSSQLRHLRNQSAGLGREIRGKWCLHPEVGLEYLWVERTTCGQEVTYLLVHNARRLGNVIRRAGTDAICPVCLSHYFGGR